MFLLDELVSDVKFLEDLWLCTYRLRDLLQQFWRGDFIVFMLVLTVAVIIISAILIKFWREKKKNKVALENMTHLKEKIEQIGKELSNAQNEVHILLVENSQKEEQCNEVKTEISKLVTEQNDLKGLVNIAEIEISSKNEKIVDMDLLIRDFQKKIVDKELLIAVLEESLDSTTKMLEAKDDSIQTYNEWFKDLEASLKKSDEDLLMQKSQCQEFQSKIENVEQLRLKVIDLESQKNDLHASYKDMKSQLEIESFKSEELKKENHLLHKKVLILDEVVLDKRTEFSKERKSDCQDTYISNPDGWEVDEDCLQSLEDEETEKLMHKILSGLENEESNLEETRTLLVAMKVREKKALEEKLEMENKLLYLTELFSSKEVDLHKQLGEQTAKVENASRAADQGLKKLAAVQSELELARKQIEILVNELEDQEKSMKSSLSKKENKANEFMLAARKSERKTGELSREISFLKQKLVQAAFEDCLKKEESKDAKEDTPNESLEPLTSLLTSSLTSSLPSKPALPTLPQLPSFSSVTSLLPPLPGVQAPSFPTSFNEFRSVRQETVPPNMVARPSKPEKSQIGFAEDFLLSPKFSNTSHDFDFMNSGGSISSSINHHSVSFQAEEAAKDRASQEDGYSEYRARMESEAASLDCGMLDLTSGRGR